MRASSPPGPLGADAEETGQQQREGGASPDLCVTRERERKKDRADGRVLVAVRHAHLRFESVLPDWGQVSPPRNLATPEGAICFRMSRMSLGFSPLIGSPLDRV